MEDRIRILHHRKMIRNQKGFTIIEVLVTVALAAVVVLGNTMFLNDFMRRMAAYEKESGEESDLAVLNTMALNILKKSSLSFNRLTLADDNNVNFFDYYPDMTLGSFAVEERKYTMNSTSKFFYILSSDEGKNGSTVYDPVHAYTVASAAADVLSDGTVAYRGINSVPDIYNASGVKASVKIMRQIFGARWANGNVFVITCPTYLRPVSGATVNLLVVPRMPTYIGKVDNDGLEPLSVADVQVPLNNTHPLTSTPYTSADQFFRTLPTVGGAAPFVKIEPASIGRFELRNSATAGFFDVYFKTWTANGYANEIQVALKVKKVTFKRKSITLPLISMEIQK